MLDTFRILKLECMSEDLPIGLDWWAARDPSSRDFMIYFKQEKYKDFLLGLKEGNWRLPHLDEMKYIMKLSQLGILNIHIGKRYWLNEERLIVYDRQGNILTIDDWGNLTEDIMNKGSMGTVRLVRDLK